MTSLPKIAIIGGGPSGLLLARILHINSIPFTVYESDPSPTTRSQGGTLDLHPESGQHAMRTAEIWDEFMKYARPEGEAMVVADQYNKVFLRLPDDLPKPPEDEPGQSSSGSEPPPQRPEIDRGDLRRLLLDSIPADSVKWDHRISSISPSTKTINFTSPHLSPVENTTLLIGADGAFSHVRPLLSPSQAYYSGICGVEFWYRSVSKRHPRIAAFVGEGGYFTYGKPSAAILSQLHGDDSIRVMAYFRAPEDYLDTTPAIASADAKQIKNYLLENQYQDWAAELRALIAESDEGEFDIITRKMYMLPVGHRWAHVPGVTCVGDAAHLMTPFAGEGANLALRDASDLGEAIVAGVKGGHEGLEASLARFEEAMFVRAHEAAANTWRNLNLHFTETGDGAKQFTDDLKAMIARIMAGEAGEESKAEEAKQATVLAMSKDD